MTRKNLITLGIILIVFVLSLWTLLPVDSVRLGRQGLHLGLDLVGGVHLVYEADFPEDADSTERRLAMDRTLETIRNRIDNYGVAEPVIQQVGDDRILVQLPGFTDIGAAKGLVEETGFLEFREVELKPSGDPVNLGDYFTGTQTQFFDRIEAGDRIFVKDYLPPNDPEWGNLIGNMVKTDDGISLVDIEGNIIDPATLPMGATQASSWIISRGAGGTALTGELLKNAQPNVDQSGVAPKYVVSIEWESEGSDIFDEVAARLFARPQDSVQRALGIFLDSNLLSSPQIRQSKYQGSAQIEGNFTPQEVEKLANFLRSGALPMPLKQPPLYQEKISATLGADFIEMSWLAGLIGIILVMIFMIAYYKIPGLLASLSLIFYGALVLAIFKLWPVTLSLAGLGGFILSIGMAVDANVLIFERMKEELRAGRTLGAAIEAGFNRAWSAIRDSNITTIIVCLILIWLASSIVASAPVMGFAWTLLIGVVVSMFTAILVTRTLLRLFVGGPLSKKTGLFSVDWGKKQ